MGFLALRAVSSLARTLLWTVWSLPPLFAVAVLHFYFTCCEPLLLSPNILLWTPSNIQKVWKILQCIWYLSTTEILQLSSYYICFSTSLFPYSFFLIYQSKLQTSSSILPPKYDTSVCMSLARFQYLFIALFFWGKIMYNKIYYFNCTFFEFS